MTLGSYRKREYIVRWYSVEYVLVSLGVFGRPGVPSLFEEVVTNWVIVDSVIYGHEVFTE